MNAKLPAPSDALASPAKAQASPQRKRGRPPGSRTRQAAQRLGHHHFSFLRASLQLPNLRMAWERYLAFEGGPDDERHFAARLKQLQTLVRTAAQERGLAALADKAFRASARRLPAKAATPEPVSAAAAPAGSPRPGLDEWVLQRCEQWGVERDFQSEADWLAEYQAEFQAEPADALFDGVSLDPNGALSAQLPAKRAATAHLQAAEGSADVADPGLRQQLEALNTLAMELVRAPTLDDPLGIWLSPSLAAHLAATTVKGTPTPLRTLSELIDFINTHRLRWHRHVPRLGATRADRLVAWLQPVASELARPLKPAALQPHAHLALQLAQHLQTVDMSSDKRFGLVTLDRLAVPPQLEGRRGTFRREGPNVLGAQTDLEAIVAWLQRHQHARCTYLNYSRVVERFYLWCVLVKRKPMSCLVESDFQDYRQFLANPPDDWIQRGAALRASEHWRPFKGPIGANSMKLNFSVISAMLSALVTAGYLTANPVGSLLPSMRLAATRMNIDRSFDEAQWKWIMRCWAQLYARVGPVLPSASASSRCPPLCLPEGVEDQAFVRAALLRRLRLVLELGASTGLRLAELVSIRKSFLHRELVDGQQVWILNVLGKGNRERETVVPDEVVALIAQHQRDQELAQRHFNSPAPCSNAFVLLASQDGEQPAPGTGSAGAAEDPFLIGPLRPGPGRWTLDARGLPHLERSSGIARHMPLSPQTISQALKRFLRHCALRALELKAPVDAGRLEQASTHWLRHFFANTAAEDGVNPAALMSAMGHKSLQTTSVYLRTDRRLLVKEMGKVRRRA